MGKRLLSVAAVACFTIWLLSNCDMGVGGVLRQGSWEDAELILYDRWGNVVFKEGCDDRTRISYITDEIVEISHWFSSPFHYAYYDILFRRRLRRSGGDFSIMGLIQERTKHEIF